MNTYRVITSSTIATEYIVKATSKEEAGELFTEGNYETCRELSDYELDSNEEIIEVLAPNEQYY